MWVLPTLVLILSLINKNLRSVMRFLINKTYDNYFDMKSIVRNFLTFPKEYLVKMQVSLRFISNTNYSLSPKTSMIRLIFSSILSGLLNISINNLFCAFTLYWIHNAWYNDKESRMSNFSLSLKSYDFIFARNDSRNLWYMRRYPCTHECFYLPSTCQSIQISIAENTKR